MRSRRPGDEAVSPVVAVILMVAIVVVLAATVFVLVGQVAQEPAQTTISVTFRQDERTDNLTVVTAGPGASWHRIQVRAAADGVGFQVSGEPVVSLTNGVWVDSAGSPNPVGAGEWIRFCYTGASAVADVTVTLRDQDGNAVLGEWTFDLVDGDCTP